MKKSLLPLLLLTLLLTGCDSPFKSKEVKVVTQEVVAKSNTEEQETDDLSEQILDTQEEIKNDLEEIKTTNEDIKVTNETALEVQQDIAEDIAVTQMNVANLELKMTQVESLETRNNSLEKLNKNKDLFGKLDHAVNYMEHLDFQLFTNSGVKIYNLEKQLEDKRAEAMEEIAAQVRPLSKKLSAGIFKKGMTGLESDNDSQSFFAFALALHAVNSNQSDFRQFVGVPVESALDIILNGLSQKDAETKELKPSERIVLENEQIFSLLVEARFKFFPILTLSQISNKGLLSKLDMTYTKWQPVFLKKKNRIEFNVAQVENLEVMLNDALKAKNALTALGKTVTLPKKVVKMYKNLDLSVSEKIKPELSGDMLNAIDSFGKKVVEILAEKEVEEKVEE